MKHFTCQFCNSSWGAPDSLWEKALSCPYCGLPIKKKIDRVETKSLEMNIYTALVRFS